MEGFGGNGCMNALIADIVRVSEQMRQDIQQFHYVGLDQDTIQVNGLNPDALIKIE